MKSFFCSTIGKKAILSVSGLIWALFVLTHMAGNFTLFLGEKKYNQYSYMITSNPALYLIEAVLLVTLIVHVFLAFSLTRKNTNARPAKYAMTPNGEKKATLASRTMIFHGSILLVFIIIHLQTFKYGTYYEVTYDGVTMRNLYQLVIEKFQDPVYVAGYAVAMFFLCIHLYHGFASIFQTWGFQHPRYTPMINKFGKAYGFIIALGFIAGPLYVYGFLGLGGF